MDLSLFIKGCLVGFSVAAPIGPICLLCIRQAAAFGFWAGVFTGLAASIADAIYASGVALGASAVNEWLQTHAFWFHLCGGIFLLYLAYTLMRTKLSDLTVKKERMSLLVAFGYCFTLSFLSPMTTFLFMSMFASYGIFDCDLTAATAPVAVGAGAAVGAMVWWVILSYAISRIYMVKPELNCSRLIKAKGGFGAFKWVLLALWPHLRKNPHLNLFLLINRVAAVCIGVYGMLTFVQAMSD